ncbi:uncharacterized protein DFL_004371 [Arthrobotrys flagrans]|uniref:Uncharacterized protein n=1 Tax=Arthrobotrys flagrans TaxID=97331 RepID=A0A437A4V5_ARTFL|nr:hypothetical protein DFL_004371 [Arthrobotrys flagrans]
MDPNERATAFSSLKTVNYLDLDFPQVNAPILDAFLSQWDPHLVPYDNNGDPNLLNPGTFNSPETTAYHPHFDLTPANNFEVDALPSQWDHYPVPNESDAGFGLPNPETFNNPEYQLPHPSSSLAPRLGTSFYGPFSRAGPTTIHSSISPNYNQFNIQNTPRNSVPVPPKRFYGPMAAAGYPTANQYFPQSVQNHLSNNQPRPNPPNTNIDSPFSEPIFFEVESELIKDQEPLQELKEEIIEAENTSNAQITYPNPGTQRYSPGSLAPNPNPRPSISKEDKFQIHFRRPARGGNSPPKFSAPQTESLCAKYVRKLETILAIKGEEEFIRSGGPGLQRIAAVVARSNFYTPDATPIWDVEDSLPDRSATRGPEFERIIQLDREPNLDVESLSEPIQNRKGRRSTSSSNGNPKRQRTDSFDAESSLEADPNLQLALIPRPIQNPNPATYIYTNVPVLVTTGPTYRIRRVSLDSKEQEPSLQSEPAPTPSPESPYDPEELESIAKTTYIFNGGPKNFMGHRRARVLLKIAESALNFDTILKIYRAYKEHEYQAQEDLAHGLNREFAQLLKQIYTLGPKFDVTTARFDSLKAGGKIAPELFYILSDKADWKAFPETAASMMLYYCMHWYTTSFQKQCVKSQKRIEFFKIWCTMVAEAIGKPHGVEKISTNSKRLLAWAGRINKWVETFGKGGKCKGFGLFLLFSFQSNRRGDGVNRHNLVEDAGPEPSQGLVFEAIKRRIPNISKIIPILDEILLLILGFKSPSFHPCECPLFSMTEKQVLSLRERQFDPVILFRPLKSGVH